MKRAARACIVLALFLGAAAPAPAWGPQSQLAVVTTAARLISKEGSAPLSQFEREIRQGAQTAPARMLELLPDLALDPLRTIDSEMRLLQAARAARVDAYFAYRLGMLGALVAQSTAPMQDAKPLYRKLYQDDVEQHIGTVSIRTAARQIIEPRRALPDLRRQAGSRQDLIERDYEGGIGFEGVARQSLAEDVSRSVNALADVWHTLLTSRAVVANVSPNAMRDYVLQAMAFYTERGNLNEINAAYARYSELSAFDADLMKRIGDMFYGAQMYDRAVREYQAVLARDPSRKDVVRRIADYYVEQGDREMGEGRLEAGRDHYARAADADALHPTAQIKRQTTEQLIRERDARQADMRGRIHAGREREEAAEARAEARQYAEAITMLREALAEYQEVSDEFIVERRAAEAARNRVTARLRDIESRLLSSTEELSGGGTGGDVRKLATESAAAQRERVMRDMVRREYESEVRRLQQQLRGRP